MRIEDGIYLCATGREKTPALVIPRASTSYKVVGKGRKLDETLALARKAREAAAVQALVTR